MEFIYTINPEADEPIMLIDTHLGFIEGEGQGINGALFARELLALDGQGKSSIQIWICSEGGKVMDAYNIIAAMLKSKTKVNTHCIGAAASASANIFVSGRKRIMHDYSWLMFHDPYQLKPEDKPTQSDKDAVNTFRTSLVTLLSERTGKTPEEAAAIMAKESWITAEDALKEGFCDEIEYSSDKNKKRATSVPPMQEMLNSGSLHLKSIVNKFKQNKMKSVTNLLKLQPEADEASHVAAINAIENRAKSAEEKLATSDTSLKDVQAKLADATTKLTDVTNKYNTLIEANKKAEEEAIKSKATDLVNSAGEAGKFDATDKDLVEHYTKLAVADYDGTKMMFEKTGVSKKAPVINKSKAAGGTAAPSVLSRMAEIAARNQNK